VKVGKPTREGVIAKFKVEMTAEELEPHFEKAFKKTAKTIKLDGFRAGKVPVSVVKKRFGDAVRAEAIDDILQETYAKALPETDLRPLTPAKIEDVDFDPEKHLNFVCVVELAPEVVADKWQKLEIEKEVPKITDEDIDRHLDSLRREKAIVTDRPEGEAAEMNDRLKADVQEVDGDGVPVIGRKSEGMNVEIGSGVLGKGSDEQLVGIKVGETRRVMIKRMKTEKDGSQNEVDLGWDVTPTSIEKVELPEMDADFAGQINEEFKSFDDLKEDVKKQLENFANFQAEQRVAGRMIDAVVDAHEFEVPPTIVEQTLEEMIKSRKEETGGMIPEDTLRESMKPVAERQIKWFFLRQQMIKDLELKATDEEIDKHIENYASKNEGVDLESLKTMFKAPDKREQLTDEIIQGKLMDAIKEGVKFKDKEVEFNAILR
jgi:trigger factor